MSQHQSITPPHTRRLRIAIIGPAYPYRGGPALVVANTYEQLISEGHTVEVFSFSRLYPQLLFPGVRQEDISKHPAKQHPANRCIDSVNPLTWLSTAHAINAFAPDIILVDWYQPFFGLCYHVILQRITGSPRIVFMAENVISHEARFVDTFLTSLALRHAAEFIVFSAAVEQHLRRTFPKHRIQRTTLPLFFTNESSPEQWTQQRAKEVLKIANKRVLLFFGYIRKYKGLRTLLAAFPAIAQEFPDTHLLIVGECYEDADEYHQLIANSTVSASITWINEYVPNEDIALYYSASDIVVLPYISATNSGIVKIAFGFEKPIIATNVGGLAEEIPLWNAGIIVEADNSNALQNGLRTLLSKPTLDEYRIGSRNAKKANSFSDISSLVESTIHHHNSDT